MTTTTNGTTHRLLPASPDAEKGIICSFLLSPSPVAAYCIGRGVTPAHFQTPAHGIMYDELISLHEQYEQIDFILLTDRLREKGQLESVGGAASVTELFTFLPTAANAAAYVETVISKRALRDLIATGTAIAERAYIGQENAAVLVAELHEQSGTIMRQAHASGPRETLAARRFNTTTPPPKPRPIYTLADAVIATQGNIQAVTGQAKSGKTALLSGFIASTMDPTGDTLGVKSSNPDGAAVIHFDTEQSRYDHHAVIAQALRRAGRQAAPDWLHSYSLADVGIDERLRLFRHQLDAARKAHGAIHSAIIDGIGDLCHDPNDSKEAFALVAESHRLAIDYDTTIICVLHENPGDNQHGKTRGHLGSQLERKAESNLRMTKDADGITTVFTANSRHASISKERGPRFAWNDEAAMHLTVEAAATTKDSARREELRDVAVQVFRDTPATVGLTWEQLHERIESVEGLKRSGARKKYAAMMKAKVIHQNGQKYRLT